jgi:hypothetical protein
MSSEQRWCESPKHGDVQVPAKHVVRIADHQDGYECCDHCLLNYVSHTYLRATYLQHISFRVSPL